MMKNLLVFKLIAAALSLASTSVLAHTGHMPNESVHSFLHVEHLVAISAIALIAYVVSILRNK